MPWIETDPSREWWHSAEHGNSGAAYVVSTDPAPEDRVKALREVVEEVTRKPGLFVLPPRRVGF